MFDLTKEQIIERLMNINNGVGHWINAATQPWGRMFGKFEGYNNGPNDRALTYAKSFVYTCADLISPQSRPDLDPDLDPDRDPDPYRDLNPYPYPHRDPDLEPNLTLSRSGGALTI